MQTFLLIINLIVVIALISVILLQQSSAGGLGFGGDRDFMSVRGAKNALTTLTAILAAVFFVVSLLLTIVGNISNPANEVLRNIKPTPASSTQQVGKPMQISIGGDKASSTSNKSLKIEQPKVNTEPSKASSDNNRVMNITIPDDVLKKIRADQAKEKAAKEVKTTDMKVENNKGNNPAPVVSTNSDTNLQPSVAK